MSGGVTSATAIAIIRAAPTVDCRPWPRHDLSGEAWFAMTRALAADPGLRFVALWADTTQVHALLQADAPLIASVTVEAGLYAALSPARPGAALFERAIADLFGHQAADAVDVRPWLDHGTWPMLRPLSDRPVPNAAVPETAEPDLPEMAEAPTATLRLGPLPPGLGPHSMLGPAHWHLVPDGERVTRLEARLGWAHRGVLGLMRGKSVTGAARLAARIDGTATVAHSTAFARAAEAAITTEPPPRAVALRTALLSIERVAVRLHRLHEVATALDFAWPAPQAARKTLLAACHGAFGHRLLMDLVRPGGVAWEDGPLDLLDAALILPALDRSWPPLAAHLQPLAQSVQTDAALARSILATLPSGPTLLPLPHHDAEGTGLAEGPQGPVWHWLRLQHGTVAASFASSPSWLQLPALEQAAAGAEWDALPAILAASGLGIAGMDL